MERPSETTKTTLSPLADINGKSSFNGAHIDSKTAKTTVEPLFDVNDTKTTFYPLPDLTDNNKSTKTTLTSSAQNGTGNGARSDHFSQTTKTTIDSLADAHVINDNGTDSHPNSKTTKTTLSPLVNGNIKDDLNGSHVNSKTTKTTADPLSHLNNTKTTFQALPNMTDNTKSTKTTLDSLSTNGTTSGTGSSFEPDSGAAKTTLEPLSGTSANATNGMDTQLNFKSTKISLEPISDIDNSKSTLDPLSEITNTKSSFQSLPDAANSKSTKTSLDPLSTTNSLKASLDPLPNTKSTKTSLEPLPTTTLTPTKDPITCHVLDTLNGQPARSLRVTLTLLRPLGPSAPFTATTNSDGRVAKWEQPAPGPSLSEIFDNLNLHKNEEGETGEETKTVWELLFQTGEYFGEGKTFFPEVRVPFFVEAGERGGHYHVPLLLGPWSYTTYRGS